MTNIKQDAIANEKNIPTEPSKNFTIGAPDETIVKPAVILPITDAASNINPTSGNSVTPGLTALNETDTNAAGDVIDTGNNYTAAENDHDTNATL